VTELKKERTATKGEQGNHGIGGGGKEGKGNERGGLKEWRNGGIKKGGKHERTKRGGAKKVGDTRVSQLKKRQ